VLPVGGWVITIDGELRVEDDGSITPRPTPWPWTRPSIAAIPTMTVKRTKKRNP
jgi:hypothetical protein